MKLERIRRTSQRSAPYALTVPRVILGVVMIAHGWSKLTALADWQAQVASLGIPAPELMAYVAIAGELGGGLGLLFGLLTPIAAAGVASVMVFAIGFVHAGNGLFAKDNGWEFPLVILGASLYFVFRGAGPISLDRVLLKRFEHKRKPTPREGPFRSWEQHA